VTTAREVLALIITGDGRGAITEIEKVGGAAERELGRADDRLALMGSRLTTWGAAAVGTGAVAAVGLYGAAQAAGQLDANLARIDGNFGAAAAGAQQFVRDANDVGLADQAAAQYVANIGELAVGLGIGQNAAAGMTVETVRLVSQLALLKGQSPADALDAVSAGLIGEYDSLQRLVPSISAAAIQERALADTRKASADELTMAEKATATFAIINESAAATLARSGDVTETNAFRNAQLAASYGDLKTEAGDAALPVIEQLVGVLTDGAEAVSAADEASNGLVGTLATYATVGALAGGGLAFVAGQGIKAYEMATELGGRLRTTEGDLTKTGQAAAGLSIALGALAAFQVASALNDASRDTVGLATAVNELKSATSNADIEATIADGAAATAGTVDDLSDALYRLTTAGRDVGKIQVGEFSVQIDDLTRFLDELYAKDPEQLARVLDYLGDIESLRPPNLGVEATAQFNKLGDKVNDYRAYIASAAGENEGFADSAGEVADEASSASGSLDLMAYSFDRTAGAGEKATSGARSYVDALQGAFDPILGLLDANQRLADAEEDLAAAADTNGKEIVDASRNLADARRRVEDATRSLADAQAELNDVLNDDPMFGLKSVSPEDEIADARNRLAEANRRLAANPGDALALTMRDTAVLDLEDASRRQQDERRNAEQRADDIANAQRAVEDAQRGLADANQGVVDAQGQLAEVQAQHGINSDEYAEAAQAVIEANLAVQAADADLAQWIRDNGVEAVGELNGKLDEWIARGGPVGEAAATMKAQLDPLVAQALLWASALGGVSGAYDVLLGRMALFAIAAGGAAGSAAQAGAGRLTGGVDPGQRVPVDQFGIPLYGRAAGGPIEGTGTGTSDDVLIAASAGEFMLKKSTVDALGPARVAQLNQSARWPEIVRDQPAGGAVVKREGDLVIDGVVIQLTARDDELAGAAVVESLRGVARRSGRGLRASRKLVAS
jgi:hypothetical protein